MASETLALTPEVNSAAELVRLLCARGGTREEVFAQGSMRITVNKKFVDLAAPLVSGDEVAFISAWL